MTLTPEQLGDLERKAGAAMQWTGEPVKVHFGELNHLVAVYRAALAFDRAEYHGTGDESWEAQQRLHALLTGDGA